MTSSSTTPRKLKRRASKIASTTIFDSPCISGGRLKGSEIIPVHRGSDGEQIVHVRTSTKWIHAVLSGYQSSTVARAILSKAIADIKACWQTADNSQSSSSAGGDGPDSAEMIAMRAKMAEAGLLSDSDQSGEDDDGSNSEIEEKRAPKNKSKKDAKLQFSQVKVHEIDIEVAQKNNMLALTYTVENVNNFLKLCLHYDQEEVVKFQEDKKKKIRQQAQEL